MRKIINNKVYDTDTARRLGCVVRGTVHEELYMKKTREFFMYKFDEKTKTSAIIPIEFNAALEIARKMLSPETYEEIFGTDDSRKSNITLYLKNESIKKLRAESARSGKPIGEIIDEFVLKKNTQ